MGTTLWWKCITWGGRWRNSILLQQQLSHILYIHAQTMIWRFHERLTATLYLIISFMTLRRVQTRTEMFVKAFLIVSNFWIFILALIDLISNLPYCFYTVLFYVFILLFFIPYQYVQFILIIYCKFQIIYNFYLDVCFAF